MTDKKKLDEKMSAFSLRKTATALGHYDNAPVPAKAEEPVKGEKDYTRFNFICDTGLVQKVRDISTKEGVTIRQIMEKAMTDWLTKYEKKNGPVGNVKARSIEDL